MMTQNAAAVLLCAGKGTRMNDDSKNKVCFDCAGKPVIRRIVERMRRAGVSRFVIVVGYQAQSVMDSLDGLDGIVYAYQREQKGTGHATLCGLKALQQMGYSGPVLVSMGDKVVSERVLREILGRSEGHGVVWGVQPLERNPQGGHVMVRDGRPCGMVEMPDAALMSLSDVPSHQWKEHLTRLGLNEKKARKVLEKAKETAPCSSITLAGERFSVHEVLHTPWVNAALCCFDLDDAMEAIGTLGSQNAQGEVYLTDTLAWFASRGQASLFCVDDPEELLTFSTKPELREMGFHFLRPASSFLDAFKSGGMDETLENIYGAAAEQQKPRYLALLEHFIATYGDQKVIISRAPGRVNLMGRHIDHRGGSLNVMTIDRDTLFVAGPRSDDQVFMSNVDPAYPQDSFSIGAYLAMAPHDEWLPYLESEPMRADLAGHAGLWSNYVKASVLRFQLETEMPLCGMNLAATGNIPVAAGLSSSSSIVVAVSELVVSLNCLNITTRRFIDLCGEGEWFVGSRGGAGDHAAMKASRRGHITHLGFKPFTVGASVAFSDQYAVLVVDSQTKARKSEGAKDKFNAKVTSYEIAFMLICKSFPSYGFREFRDLAAVRPYSELYKMLLSIPETASRAQIRRLLPEYEQRLNQLFSSHADPGRYDLRAVTLFGVSECARAERCVSLLENRDYARLGELMKISHDGDRVTGYVFPDRSLEALAEENADFALQCGAYDCSTPQIDALCDLLNRTPGVLGCNIAGAGLGGCVVALVERNMAEHVIEVLNHEYYDPHGYPHGAAVYVPSSGSGIIV